MPHIFINTNRSLGTIDPNIYGQFSEHLGRCIYQGIYVGENAEIPNSNGMRCDVVNALKALHIPVLRWPGGRLGGGPTPPPGAMVSARRRSARPSSTPTGAASARITPSAPMSSWN